MKSNKTGRLNTEANQFRYYSYARHLACFTCRKMFNHKAASFRDWSRKVDCPQCGTVLNDMGHDFKAPRKNDIKQWRKVELLFRRGYRWQQNHVSELVSDGKWTGWRKYVTKSDSPAAHTLREAREDYPPLQSYGTDDRDDHGRGS